MIKKASIIFILLFIFIPSQVFGIAIQRYEVVNNQVLITVFVDPLTESLEIRVQNQWDIENGRPISFEEEVIIGPEKDNMEHTFTFSCPPDIVNYSFVGNLSDGTEKVISMTFDPNVGTECNEPQDPPTMGTDLPPKDGSNDGSITPGTGDGGTDPGTGDGGTDPGTGDDVFNSPKWDEYMNKIDEIISKIPPAPNWDEVAGKIRDAIVPALIDDLGDLLGSAPSTRPTPPAQLPPSNTGGIESKVPVFTDTPGLGEAGSSLDLDNIKGTAPTIEFRDDPTGGFNLGSDPIESLPDFPTDSLPMPGTTDPGEWGLNQPIEQDNPFPFPAGDTGEAPTVENPPLPSDPGGEAPTPGTDTGTAPIPGDSGLEAPSPDGSTLPGMKYYKPTPDSPDGSGGDMTIP